MSIVTIAYLLIGLVLFESALNILKLQPQARLNRICAMLILLFTVFCFSFGLFAAARNREAAWVLMKICLFLSCFMGSTLLHFLLVLGYERKIRRMILQVPLYLPAVILASYSLFNPLVVVDVTLTPWGWDNVMKTNMSGWDLFYLYYTLGFTLFGVVLASISGYLAEDPVKKRQIISLVLVSCMGAFLVILISTVILNYSLIPEYIQSVVGNLFTGFLILFWLLGLRYVMWKEKLLILLPQASSKGLFSKLGVPILLTDAENRVLYANNEAEKAVLNGNQRDQKLVSRPINTLVEDYHLIKNEVEKTVEGQRSRFDCTVRFAQNREEYFRLNIHPIHNERNDYLGNMMLINPVQAYDHLQEAFGLTEKETEILRLIERGMSVPEMAQHLKRSELTVKTHIRNIYRKTGVNNRVQLTQLSARI